MNAKQREALYDRCRDGKEFPDCNLCGLPVTVGHAWDESHVPVPKALGGTETGIAHRVCNHIHNNKVVTPVVAKVKRLRRKHLGVVRPGMGKHRMPGGRASGQSRTMRHGVVARITLSQRLAQLGLVER